MIIFNESKQIRFFKLLNKRKSRIKFNKKYLLSILNVLMEMNVKN